MSLFEGCLDRLVESGSAPSLRSWAAQVLCGFVVLRLFELRRAMCFTSVATWRRCWQSMRSQRVALVCRPPQNLLSVKMRRLKLGLWERLRQWLGSCIGWPRGLVLMWLSMLDFAAGWCIGSQRLWWTMQRLKHLQGTMDSGLCYNKVERQDSLCGIEGELRFPRSLDHVPGQFVWFGTWRTSAGVQLVLSS